MSSSQEPTRATADHAATAAPTGPCPKVVGVFVGRDRSHGCDAEHGPRSQGPGKVVN